MSKLKIAFFEVKDWEKDYLANKLTGFDLEFFEEILTEENAKLASDCDSVSVFIYSKVTKECINKLKKCKLITTRSTGFDHIDIDCAKEKNIIVSNVPFYGENTVAEHTFGLLLSLSRKLPKSISRVNKGNFSREGLQGFDLKGRTIGVVGSGNIGIHVIRIARGFQMKVIAYDVVKDDKKAAEYGFHYVTMDELLKQSDIITLHVPLNKHTMHIIGKQEIQKMKDGVILINTSRGGLIDTESLVEGLQNGKIKGAGLDALEEETFIDEEIQLLAEHPNEKQRRILANHILLRIPHVLITPHNAFNSQEALERILDTTIENINCFKEEKPCNLV